VRYWGGTKLGTGGLARAYSAATRLAVEDAGLSEVVQRVKFEVELPFELMGLRSELEAKCLSIKFDGEFTARGWHGVISLSAGKDVEIFNQLITDKGGGRRPLRQSESN
jgi:putative IMPACT (imprinted ancient) family translation regulator